MVLLPHGNALVGGVRQVEFLVVVIVYTCIMSVIRIFSFCGGLELSSLVSLGTGDVERRIIGFSNTLDNIVISGHCVCEVIGDEDPPDV